MRSPTRSPPAAAVPAHPSAAPATTARQVTHVTALRVVDKVRNHGAMTDQPWQGDACSLVDAFRSGERSPLEEVDVTLAAIEASGLNAFSFLDPDRARHAAANADISLPFGGVPTGVKELERVEGWPDTEASLVFRDRIADRTGHSLLRLFGDGGAVPVELTTA